MLFLTLRHYPIFVAFFGGTTSPHPRNLRSGLRADEEDTEGRAASPGTGEVIGAVREPGPRPGWRGGYTPLFVARLVFWCVRLPVPGPLPTPVAHAPTDPHTHGNPVYMSGPTLTLMSPVWEKLARPKIECSEFFGADKDKISGSQMRRDRIFLDWFSLEGFVQTCCGNEIGVQHPPGVRI